MFAYYNGCDPLKAGMISAPDLVLTLFQKKPYFFLLIHEQRTTVCVIWVTQGLKTISVIVEWTVSAGYIWCQSPCLAETLSRSFDSSSHHIHFFWFTFQVLTLLVYLSSALILPRSNTEVYFTDCQQDKEPHNIKLILTFTHSLLFPCLSDEVHALLRAGHFQKSPRIPRSFPCLRLQWDAEVFQYSPNFTYTRLLYLGTNLRELYFTWVLFVFYIFMLQFFWISCPLHLLLQLCIPHLTDY